ncbi:MAG: tripartite tricarboxylate transporter TctB family protein [Alphaproteobacteria bacterium]|nr:tripartite tricarboxylate transporter TctB family protein [Alphaproteobacteria bacterium]
MRRVHQLTGLACLLLAGFLGYNTLALPYYTRLGPGPGFFPRWLCAILAALALVILARASWSKDEPLPSNFFPERRGGLRIAIVIAALIAVANTMSILGFQLAMLAFYLLVLAALGRWRWIETPVLAVLGSFGCYYAFSMWLNQPLPTGRLGF